MSVEAPTPSTTTVENRQEPSLGSLVSGIIGDVEKLLSQHLAMVRREFRDDARKAIQALTLVAFGAAITLIAGIALAFALAYAIQSAFPTLSMETCFAIVGGSLAVIGCAMLYGGVQLLAAIDPMPTRTIESLEENVQCILKTTPKTNNSNGK